MANRDGNNELLLYGGALAIIYFGVIRPLTNALGLTDDPEDRANELTVDQAANSPGWSPGYYKSYQDNPANAGKVLCLKTQSTLAAMAGQIYNAWGTFNDDEQAIYAVFRQLNNQLQLSQLAEKYSQLYQQDLLTRLRAKWSKWDDGLLPEEFVDIAKIVTKLPVNSSC